MLPFRISSRPKGAFPLSSHPPTHAFSRIDQDAVFKALADPTRRRLLDLLRERDGRTLVALHEPIALSRQAVMRHLSVLEEAGLVTTRRVGREKHHYLNAVPIQLVYDRWVDRFTRPVARGLTRLKYALEGTMNEPAAIPRHVFQVHIATTPEKLWRALTDGDLTEQYYFGTRFEGDLRPGAPYSYRNPDGGEALLDGEIVEATPYERLVMTFRPLFNLDAGADPAALNTSRTTFTIEPEGAVCKLVLVHDEMTAVDTVDGYGRGWARILSGLKTLLETGRPLPWREAVAAG